MTTRKRVLSLRLGDSEYQTLKSMAAQAGISAPVLVRRLALDSVQLAPRLDAIERLIQGIPDRPQMVAAFQRLAEKIDRQGAKTDRATNKEGVSP